MSDIDDSPLFEEVSTSPFAEQESEKPDDSANVLFGDNAEGESDVSKPESDQGLPASLPVKIDPEERSDSPKKVRTFYAINGVDISEMQYIENLGYR